MSLYSALSAGVSGLSAEASAMATVADNISNINTVGYKTADAQFSSLVGDGRVTNSYTAGGVSAAPRTLISKQGILQASSSATDFAIEGQGFFVTRTSTDSDSSVMLTRAGSFAPDKDGYLKNTAGLFLQGWRLDEQGGFVNTGSVDTLEPVRLSDLTGTATPTATIQMRANFQQSTPIDSSPYVSGDLASGKVTSDFSRELDVYDAQGGVHRITLAVVKSGVNEWEGEFFVTPKSDVTATGGVLASGTIKFNEDGSLNRDGSDDSMFDDLVPEWTNGASAIPISLSLGDNGSMNGLTQSSSISSVISQSVDGGPLGNVASISISDKGVVSAIFENSTKRAVFQLPVATVPNPDGLARANGNAFVTSEQSGAYSINTPGSLGAGKISGFKLEASTADLAQEFTNMIRFQRAYSASSKIITTVDDMLQEVSNLKR